MSEIHFEPWPKIARLNREVTVTEKIDGTNGAILVTDDLEVHAQSRKRLISPAADNFGFARWVEDNSETLASLLGPGRHFGEWWGHGIQRGYGLAKGDRRFSLFNTRRYAELDALEVPGLGVVPVLYQGPWRYDVVADYNDMLEGLGSEAAPGFMDPEGVILYHSAADMMFKVTIKGDDAPKGV